MSEIDINEENSWLNILIENDSSHREKYNEALEYIKQNFMELYPDDLFLQLDHETFCNLLESDDLNVVNEEVVFDSVRRWITFNHLNPEKYLKSILKVARLSLLPVKYLLDEVEPFVNQILNGREDFFDVLQYNLLDENRINTKLRKHQKLYLNNIANPPNCEIITNDKTDPESVKLSMKLLSIGNSDLNKTCILEVYDDKDNQWTQLKDLKIDRINYTVANVGENVLIIGGVSNKNQYELNTVESINLRTGKVLQIAPLIHRRQHSTAVVARQGKLPIVYVFGGIRNENALKWVERWDSLSQVWTAVTPMTVARTGHGAVLLKNEIYVVGGRLGNKYDKTVEAYDFENDRWIPKASMNNPKAYFGISTFKNCIYVAGGNIDSGAPVNTVERYDPTLNVWTTIANISSNGVVGISGLENKLICAGGASSNIVEKYDEANNQWIKLSSLNTQHSGFLMELQSDIEIYSGDWLIQNRSSEKFIFIGHVDYGKINTVETFDIVESKWTRMKNLPLYRHFCTVNIIDNKLVFIGGTGIDRLIDIVDYIDLSSGIMRSLPPKKGRQSPASVVVQEGNREILYILGGKNKYGEQTALVEKWDPKTEEWTNGTPMTSGREGHGVVFLNGKIYIFGGMIGMVMPEYLKTVETYDIKSDVWESKASMNKTRAFFGITIFKDRVYIVGGEIAYNEHVNLVERYDPIDDSWSTLANIQSSYMVGVCSIADRLICAGGDLNTVEEYNETKNEWVSLPSINENGSGILLKLPENSKLYI